MPTDWNNWGGSWDVITQRYGITHSDIDMSSAEEIAMFKAEADNPTKDITDIGFGFCTVAIAEDVVQGYKPKNWDRIPDWAKDPQGRWIVYCIGTHAWGVNTYLTKGRIPTTWKELREGDYIVNCGQPLSGGSSQAIIISAAYAFGGGVDNVQPGIDFFKELARQKRVVTANGMEAMARGEIMINLDRYDYTLIGWRDLINAQGTSTHVEVVIPQDGAISVGSAVIFNKYAPHPHATALVYEYLFSDEGQIDRAKGNARPIMTGVKLPADVENAMLDSSQYVNTIPLEDPEAYTKACQEVARLWEEEVLPLMN
jgi:putative spermidine/putrescine transport system substrate-binding protein